MKKIILTSLFTIYQLFIPFVMTNCGGDSKDEPYNVNALPEEQPKDCNNNGVLTEDCVDNGDDSSAK